MTVAKKQVSLEEIGEKLIGQTHEVVAYYPTFPIIAHAVKLYWLFDENLQVRWFVWHKRDWEDQGLDEEGYSNPRDAIALYNRTCQELYESLGAEGQGHGLGT